MSHNLRLATADDRELFISLATEFFHRAKFRTLSLSTKKLHELFDVYLLGNKARLIIIMSKDTGFIIGTSNPPVFSDDLIACELGWFSINDDRKELTDLFRAYEVWAEKVGSKVIAKNKQYPNNSKDGYFLQEETFMKEIKWQ